MKDNLEENESGNWNPAKHYSNLKVMKHLYLCDEFQTIAKFGDSSFGMSSNEINLSRIEALKKLTHTLKVLIENTKFAVKATFKDDLDRYYQKLKLIEDNIYLCSRKINNHVKRSFVLKINEDNFNLLLEKILEIKTGLNDPLNKSNLIFTYQEEFDPQAYKQKIKEDAINRG